VKVGLVLPQAPEDGAGISPKTPESFAVALDGMGRFRRT
jgi:hypothetical protein